MTTFHDREKAAENKYAHDKETEFRIHARRNKLLGLWAASRMNLTGKEAEDYSKTLIAATVNAHHDDHIVERVQTDFSANGITISDHDVREELYRVNLLAAEQIHSE